MRIDLNTTFIEKNKAKALGARWDYEKRCWYIVDPADLTPFLRWIPSAASGVTNVHQKQRQHSPKLQRKSYGTTGPLLALHCGCDVLPWDNCIHTKP